MKNIDKNVDKDVAAMLQSLKKYDILAESVAPVLMARPKLVELKDPNIEDDLEDVELEEDSHLKGGKKSEWSDNDKDIFKGTAEKVTDKVKNAFKPKDKKDDKEKVEEGADPEVLEWMKRFAKLGKMSGY